MARRMRSRLGVKRGRVSKKTKASKRRRLISGPLANVARSGGRVARVAAAAMGARRIWDSVGSANREKAINAARGLASKVRRKLNFNKNSNTKAVEGVSLITAKGKSFNIGGRQQLVLGMRDRPLWTKVVTVYGSMNRGGINSGAGAYVLNSIDNGLLPIRTFDLTYKQWLTQADAYLDSFGWGLNQTSGWVAGVSNTNEAVANLTAAPAVVYKDNGLQEYGHLDRITTWLDAKQQIKLMLYGRAKQSTRYRVIFWRTDDEELNPHTYGIDASWDTAKQVFLPMIQPFTTNPASVSFNRNPHIGLKNKRIKILKQFDYRLKEQLSTEDMTNRLAITYNVYINKLKSHRYQQFSPPVTDITNVDQPVVATSSNHNATRYCNPNQRIYMSIIGETIETEGQNNYEAPSFDFGLKQTMYASNIQ